MTPRQHIVSVTATALLIALGISWRAGRVEEHLLPAPEGISSAETSVAPSPTPLPDRLLRFERRDASEAQLDLTSSFARLADIQSRVDADDYLAAVEAWVDEVPHARFRFALERLSNADRSGLVGQLLVRRWTALDPRAAAEWTEQLAEPEARSALHAAVALAWSETDLPGALTWARALPGGDAGEHVLTQLGYEVARENPAEALALAVNLPPIAERDALILHGLRQWAAADADAARAWLLQWPESALRQRALADFATVLADQDGGAGARFAVAHPAAGVEFERAVIGVVQRWAQRDLPATQAWIETFPATSLRDQAGQVVANIGSH